MKSSSRINIQWSIHKMYSKNSNPNSPNKWTKELYRLKPPSFTDCWLLSFFNWPTDFFIIILGGALWHSNIQTAHHTSKMVTYVQLVNNYHISTKYVIMTVGFLSAHNWLMYYTLLLSADQKLFVYACDGLFIWTWTVVYANNIIRGGWIHIHPI